MKSEYYIFIRVELSSTVVIIVTKRKVIYNTQCVIIIKDVILR